MASRVSVIPHQHEVVWRIHPLAQLHWRRWNDDWVVFDEGSGQTHQMDTLTAIALLLLEAEPAASASLTERAACELQIEADPNLPRALGDVLERLSAVGLIEVV